MPVGIAAILMCLRFLEDPPYLKNAPAGKFDSFGVGFLGLWIGCLQVILDKGQDDDWFSSNFIRWLAVLAVIGFIVFLVRELTTPNPIVNLSVLKNRNLAIGVVLNFSVGAILYGTTAVMPTFLQLLLGYPSLQAGLVMSPRGIGAIVGSIVAGRILSKVKLSHCINNIRSHLVCCFLHPLATLCLHAMGTRRSHGLAASLLVTLWPVTVTLLVSTTDPALFSNLTVAVPVSSLPDADTVVRACTCRICPFGNWVL